MQPGTSNGLTLSTFSFGKAWAAYVQHLPLLSRKNPLLGIPAIRDRLVQGTLKIILEPIF
jgi:hypothetical protein